MYETNKRDYTLGEWLDIWLEEIAPTKRKPNTISIYRDARRRLVGLHAAEVCKVNAAPYPRYAESSIQIRNKGT